MKTFADDKAVLSTITPDQLRAYLTAQGWCFAKPFLEHAEIWTSPKSGQTDTSEPSHVLPQILLPHSSSLRDYLPRMAEALMVLETVEDRSRSEILLDLLPSIPNFQTQGIITNLYEGAREGRITLMGVVLNKLQRIYLDLPEPIYELALQAYRGRILVICKGSLSKHRHALELTDLQQFNFDLETPTLATLAAS